MQFRRYLLTGAVLTAVLWAGLVIWSTTLQDPITAWGFGLIGTVVLWVLLALAFAPPQEFEREAGWVYEEPRQHVHNPTQAELDAQHQRHLAEQARYLYLGGEQTPPTDWRW
jgi:hypothetical protein